MEYSALCRQVLGASLGVRRGDRVWIGSRAHTASLAQELFVACRRRGCDATVTVEDESERAPTLLAGPSKQPEEPSPQQAKMLRNNSHFAFTLAPAHPVDWTRIAERRRKPATVRFLGSNKFVKARKSMAARHRVKMLGTEATLATGKGP